MLILKNRQKMI